MFSMAHYEAVAEAFIAGLEDRQADGNPVEGVASVASMFVSRVDRFVDPLLPASSPLKLSVGIANARLTYERFQQMFFGRRFKALRESGAQLQRILWASTSMKDPSGRDVHYVESLIGPYSVNTIPPKTLAAFEDHGEVHMTIIEDLEAAEEQLESLKKLGIEVADVGEKLQLAGVKSFAAAYEDLLRTVSGKRESVLA